MGFLRTAGTYACHLRGQNLANAVSELLHPEHGTLYRYISVRQPSADNSSSLGPKFISSNASTYDFYLQELLRSELTYLLTYLYLTCQWTLIFYASGLSRAVVERKWNRVVVAAALSRQYRSLSRRRVRRELGSARRDEKLFK